MASVVRIVDATLHADGGPVELVVAGLDRAADVADAVLHAGASARVDSDRLTVVARTSQLVDAAGRTGGATLAEPLRDAVDAAVACWSGEVPAIETPMGVLPTHERAVVMGIVNVTPDSFSDGGEHLDTDAAVAHGRALAGAGADVVDVGGESTRPGAAQVGVDEELARVVPVVELLAAGGLVVSVDTTKAAVAEAAVRAGASMVNDVAAGRADPAMLPTVAALGVPYVLMHMQGTPQDMQQAPRYDDVVAEVTEFLAAGLARLEGAGIPGSRVLVDPGIGFGKSLEHNLVLLRRLRELTSLGRPVLVGTSRKAWLGSVTGVRDPAGRGLSSAVSAALAVGAGARVVRVHDVAATVEAVAVAQAVARAGVEPRTAP